MKKTADSVAASCSPPNTNTKNIRMSNAAPYATGWPYTAFDIANRMRNFFFLISSLYRP